MGEGIMDKVNVNVGGGEGGTGGLGAMAAIAALGNRNEQSAAGVLPMVAAMMGRNRDDGFGGGIGAGFVGGVIGGALFGNRRGGLFGGGDGGDCGGGGAENRIEDTVFNTAVLAKLGTIEAGQGLAAAQTENVILNQTNQITNLANQNALQNAGGFERTGDRIQTVGTALAVALSNVNQNVLEQGCQTRAAIAASETAILSRIDRAEIDSLRHERDRFERQVEVNALRSQVEITNTNTATATQAQAQAQAQFQFQDLNNRLSRVCDLLSVVHQEQRSTNANIIAGNAGAVTTGAQTSTPTNVNAK